MIEFRLKSSVLVWAILITVPIMIVTSQAQTRLEGQVTDAVGSSVTIAITSDLVPSVGDRVEISANVPGLGTVPLQGSWAVREVNGSTVVAGATTDANAATPQRGQQAVIFSANPRQRAADPSGGPPTGPGNGATEIPRPSAPGPLRMMFNGRIVDAIYEKNTDGNGAPIDMYFYRTTPAPGAPEPVGDQVWNKFVRSPAVGSPGGPVVWWHFHWQYTQGSWQYIQEKGVPPPQTPRPIPD